jgi:transcriptional regulator
MYRPKAFRVDDPAALAAFIQQYPLASLVTYGEATIHTTHLPMYLVELPDGNRKLLGHIARANEQWKRTDPAIPALAVFLAASHYISPNWYPSKRDGGRVVPTYDYAVVEARGPIRFFDDAATLRDVVAQLTRIHEARVGENWSIDDAPPEYIEAQLRAIVGVELEVTGLEGAFKLNQNHPDENLASVIAALRRLDTPDAEAIAALMDAHRRDAK